MNSKDESESSKFGFGDMTPRFVRQLKGQNETLYKEHIRIQEKLQKSKENFTKIQVINSGLEKENSLAKANQKKILLQKQSLEKELQELKDYTRKLEQKIAMGAKGQCLGEINSQLQVKIHELKQDKISQNLKIQELEIELENSRGKIKTLSSVCEIKADELGLTGENSQEVLYSLTSAQESLAYYKSLYEEVLENYEKTLAESQDLQIIRESNNEELNRLEEENLKLKNQVAELVHTNKEITLDRNALLQCLEEMSAQEKQYEMDIEQFTKEIEIKQLEYQGKINELHKEIELKDQIIKAKSESRKTEADLQTQRRGQEFEEIELMKLKILTLSEFEKENISLKSTVKKYTAEIAELKKELETKEKRLKTKLAMCLKELEKLVNEKEEMHNALNNAVAKCSEKLPVEDRPRQQEEALLMLSQAKQKSLDLLKQIS